MKRIFAVLLAVLLAVLCFAGCSKNEKTPDEGTSAATEKEKIAPTGGINLREKLDKLTVTDEELGIKGKYTAFEDIDGSVDSAIVGTWKTADGSITYIYNEDGTGKAVTDSMGDSEFRFTCVTAQGYNILCEEVTMISQSDDGEEEKSLVLSFVAYEAQGDTLCIVPVEERNEDYSSHQAAVVLTYRADANGSIDAAIAKYPLSQETINGTWSGDEGSFTIENGVLKTADGEYTVSIDKQNQLEVEKDGASTVYKMNVTYYKEYDYDNRTDYTEKTMLGLYYTGKNADDKPNLLSVMQDWSDFQENYYVGSFTLEQ